MKNSIVFFSVGLIFSALTVRASSLELFFYESKNYPLLERLLVIEELTATASESLEKNFKRNLKLSILCALRGDSVESARRLKVAITILEAIPSKQVSKDQLIDHLNLTLADLRQIQLQKDGM